MKRVVVLGRGGAGKSTIAALLGAVTGLPVIELDKHFWPPDLTPIPRDQWTAIQRKLISGSQWILDGDLGPYDVAEARLKGRRHRDRSRFPVVALCVAGRAAIP